MFQRLLSFALALAGQFANKGSIVLELLSIVIPQVDERIRHDVALRIAGILESNAPAEQIWLEINGVLAEYAETKKLLGGVL